MVRDDSHGTSSGQAAPEHRLVLELVIAALEPFSGLVGLVDAPDRIPFHGWIDLMSAVHTLCDRGAAAPPAPS